MQCIYAVSKCFCTASLQDSLCNLGASSCVFDMSSLLCALALRLYSIVTVLASMVALCGRFSSGYC